MASNVVTSLHNSEADRCVDVIRRQDGTFSFKEFRRDAEDGGGWTLVSDYTHRSFSGEHEAVAAAKTAIAWLRDQQQPTAMMRTAGPRVVATLHNQSADRCVKIIEHRDGAFGFSEFRKDPEDAGGWTLVRESASVGCETEAQALTAARARVGWLRDSARAEEKC
jgi:hypothetical protein